MVDHRLVILIKNMASDPDKEYIPFMVASDPDQKYIHFMGRKLYFSTNLVYSFTLRVIGIYSGT